MFGLSFHKLPRMSSFADAERFFNEAPHRKKTDPNVVFLTRYGDQTKTMIKSVGGKSAEHATHYAIKYHNTKLITYSKGAHGEFLHLDTGHESMSDRGILHYMSPFCTETFRNRTVVRINGGSYVFNQATFERKDDRWEIDDMVCEADFMQLKVVKRLSKLSQTLLADITNYYKIAGTTERRDHEGRMTFVGPGIMLDKAVALLESPTSWLTTAKSIKPIQLKLLRACLLIAEGGVVKQEVPRGELPTKCVYDEFESIVPLVKSA